LQTDQGSLIKTYIGEAPGIGRGVFAAQDIAKWEVIEICPVLAVSPAEALYLDLTLLGDYYYAWAPELTGAAIALGHGSLYNHSYTPNAWYSKDFNRGQIQIISLREIAKGEEIRFNYNSSPMDPTPMRFDPK